MILIFLSVYDTILIYDYTMAHHTGARQARIHDQNAARTIYQNAELWYSLALIRSSNIFAKDDYTSFGLNSMIVVHTNKH